MVFMFAAEYNKPDHYFHIKLNQLEGENNNEIMISIIDASYEIICKNE